MREQTKVIDDTAIAHSRLIKWVKSQSRNYLQIWMTQVKLTFPEVINNLMRFNSMKFHYTNRCFHSQRNPVFDLFLMGRNPNSSFLIKAKKSFTVRQKMKNQNFLSINHITWTFGKLWYVFTYNLYVPLLKYHGNIKPLHYCSRTIQFM